MKCVVCTWETAGFEPQFTKVLAFSKSVCSLPDCHGVLPSIAIGRSTAAMSRSGVIFAAPITSRRRDMADPGAVPPPQMAQFPLPMKNATASGA